MSNAAASQGGPHSVKIGYITSRFPHLTETFILTEILTLQELGCGVQVFSLRPPVRIDGIIHAVAAPMRGKTAYSPYLLSRSLWAAQRRFISRSPKQYLETALDLTKFNASNPFALAKAWLVFPKAVHFAKLVEDKAIQHVHASFSSLPATGAWIVARLTNVPYSFAARAVDIYATAPWLQNVMLGQKLQSASFVVAITEHGRQHLLRRYGQQYADKVTVIHSSIDTKTFQPRPRVQRQKSGTARVLAIGRLVEKKGYAYLIQACRLLVERGCRLQCYIVGAGPEEGALRTQIDRLGLRDTVFLQGAMAQQDLVGVYAGTDVFVAPSVVARNGDRDGIPVVLMEALAMEKAAVSTPVSGIPELIVDGDTGLLVAQRDAMALAEAIERLIQDPGLRVSLGRRGRQRVLDQFERIKNGSHLLALIEDSVAEWELLDCNEAPPS